MFLHGIEILESTIGPLPVTIVRSGVIGLVGTAPTFAGSTRPAWYNPPENGVVPAWTYGDGAKAAFPLWNPDAVQGLTIRASNLEVITAECVVDSNGAVQQVKDASGTDTTANGVQTKTGVTSGSAPAWATDIGAETVDGTVTWKLVQKANTFGRVNVPQLVNGSSSGAGFGPKIRGYTIPYALRAIALQGGAQVIVVNVFNPNTHVATVTGESQSFAASGIQEVTLAHMGVSNVVVDGGTLGADYTLDQVNGKIKLVTGGAIAAGSTISVSYTYADPTEVTNGVTAAAVIGDSTPPGTGIGAFQFCFSKYGFAPKILIAPGFSYLKEVADALTSAAGALSVKGVCVIDSPGGVDPSVGGSNAPQVSQDALEQEPTVSDALANRADVTKGFSASDERAILVYPNLMFQDDGADPDRAKVINPTVSPYSAFYAGAMAQNDAKRGYWDSPSNIVLLGTLGPDSPIIMSAIDPTSDTNTLNAAGIVTVYSSFGTGLRVWGNRSSAYPTETKPQNFISIRRTLDVIEDSLEQFSLQFLDRPINNALIQSILQSVNSFIHLLIQRGALISGSTIRFDADSNPPAEIAAGHLTFSVDVMPPPPLEKLTYEFFVDTALLKNLTTVTG